MDLLEDAEPALARAALLRPNDPSEQINQTGQVNNNQAAIADRYVAAQLRIVEGETHPPGAPAELALARTLS